MKKIIILLFSIALFSKTDAQTKTLSELKTDSIGSKVIQYMAHHQADSIYIMTGKKFREKISQDDFKGISENQLYPLNDFKKVSFIKTVSGINKYKVEGSPELQLLVGLDSQFMIETLLIQPYSED
ncbi:MAG: hypothetical protein ABI237_11865 [Ginsengibacter sp.]